MTTIGLLPPRPDDRFAGRIDSGLQHPSLVMAVYSAGSPSLAGPLDRVIHCIFEDKYALLTLSTLSILSRQLPIAIALSIAPPTSLQTLTKVAIYRSENA